MQYATSPAVLYKLVSYEAQCSALKANPPNKERTDEGSYPKSDQSGHRIDEAKKNEPSTTQGTVIIWSTSRLAGSEHKAM